MTSPSPESLAVAASYQQSSAALRDKLDAFVESLWQSLGEYRQPQLRDFKSQVIPMVAGAMSQMQALTSAYLAAMNAAAGASATPVATTVLDTQAVRGVPADTVYTRPFEEVWRSLQQAQQKADVAGVKPPDGWVDDAIESGLNRAKSLAATDVQLAKTHTSQRVMLAEPSITGYRRQLEGPYSCALCIVASTRRYKKADLMPIHPACDCSVVPIRTGETTDLVLSKELLAAAHDSINQRFGADSTAARKIRGATKDSGAAVLYRDVLITHEHGELGPVLAVRGQRFQTV